MKRMSNRAVKVLLAFVLLQPILALVHEILVVAAAALVRAFFGADFLYQFVRQFLASPVYAKIMVEMLGGVHAEGITVAGLPGQILHQFFPSLFLDSSTIATQAWISAIIGKNSTVLGFYVTQVLVEFLVIVLGFLILQFGLKKRSVWNVLQGAPVFDMLCVVVGLFMAAQAIWAAFSLTMSPALAGLRETGIGVGFSLLLQLDKQRYNWLMDELLPVLIPTVLIGTAIGTAWLAGKLFNQVQVAFGKQAPVAKRSIAAWIVHKAHLAIALAPLLVVSSVSPRYFGMANTSLVSPAIQVSQVPAQQPMEYTTPVPSTPTPELPTPTATPTPIPVAIETPTNVPTVLPSLTPTSVPTQVRQRQVELKRTGNKFSLVVNGCPTYVAGLNYNVNYTALPDDVKRKLHQRDFQIMQNAGVNAVIGWGVYDQVTLDIANQFGIGVIMPFELDPKGAYENKNYRDHIKNEFRNFVNTYKDLPALWGWNPGGDELLHRMETEHKRTPDKLQSASDFLLELSTLAYSIDPNHVSIVKEPRDWYVQYLEESIRRARAQKPAADPSRYFIFASNTYGKPDGVALVLNTTKQSLEDRVGVAFVVGEFAPFGMARSERPAQYAMMWNTVKEVSSIGGFAYVYGPDQPNPRAPNPYDPLRLLVSEFSLVDIEGNPVDGSLNALANQWRQ
jgi:hypothetical protein